MKLTIYGSKGSMPFFNRDALQSGGNTSCFKLDTADGTILLDCGSGLLQLNSDLQNSDVNTPIKLDILLSHLHIDHIIGLSTFQPLLGKENDIRIYTKSRSNQSLVSQIFGMFKPPYWPVDLAEIVQCKIIEIDEEPFKLNANTKITPFASSHNDDTTAFRIDAEKSVTYLLDCEIDENSDDISSVVEFCKNSDLVIFDSCYLPKDIEKKRGWGHSTYEAGIALAEMSNCKQMIFSHFSYNYTDEEINQIKEHIKCGNKFLIAYDGMELEL